MAVRRQNPEFRPAAVSRPAAAPVDTFAGVERAQPSGLAALAEALSRINPDLNRLAASARALAADEDVREAERSAAIAEARQWSEAVERGEVPAGASPVYRRAWLEARGKRMAAEFGSQALSKWLSPDNPLRNTDDPNELHRWLDQERRAFMSGLESDAATGFLSRVGQYENQLFNAFNSERIRRAEQGAKEELGTLMMQRLIEGRANPAAAIQEAQKEALGFRFAGMAGDEINRVLTQAIIAAAEQTGDVRILDAAQAPRPDLTRPGKTIPGLANTAEYGPAFVAARNRIQAAALTAENRRFVAEERARRQQAESLRGAYAVIAAESALRGEPAPLPSVEMFRQMAAVDGDLPKQILALRNAFAETGAKQTLRDVAGMLSEALRSSEPTIYLQEQIANGRLTDPARYRDLVDAVQDLRRNASALQSDAERLFRGLVPSNLEGWTPAQKITAEATWRAAQRWAEVRWNTWLVQFRQNEGRLPTAAEAAKAANEVFLEAQKAAAPWIAARRVPAYNGQYEFPTLNDSATTDMGVSALQDGAPSPQQPPPDAVIKLLRDIDRVRRSESGTAEVKRLFDQQWGPGAADRILSKRQ